MPKLDFTKPLRTVDSSHEDVLYIGIDPSGSFHWVRLNRFSSTTNPNPPFPVTFEGFSLSTTPVHKVENAPKEEWSSIYVGHARCVAIDGGFWCDSKEKAASLVSSTPRIGFCVRTEVGDGTYTYRFESL